MNLRNRNKNSRAANTSKSGKSFWKSATLKWVVSTAVAAVIAGGITYLVTTAEAEAGEDLVVTESRDSSEPPDTAVRSEEERQTEVQDASVKEEVVTTPTTSPATTAPESDGSEDGQEVSTEEESDVPTSPASQNTFGTGEDLILVKAYSLSCPACAGYHPILKQIREEYKDHITFQAVHFPLTANFSNARAAHQAVEAAARQGKFWQMHDILLERHHLWTAAYTEQPLPQLEIFAEEIGLDMEQFTEDFFSEEISDVIDEDERYLASLGVNSTPTFFFNGQQVAGDGLISVELARQALNEVLGIESEEEATPDPEEGTEGGESEGEPEESEGGQGTGTEGESEEEAVEDPEEGTEGGESEGEPEEFEGGQEAGTEDESEEAEAIPDPILPNQAYVEYIAKVSAFLEECGYWDSDRGGYRQCENPEDTQVFIQMKADFLGCEYNASRGLCEGMTASENAQLESRLACREGWSLSEPYITRGEYIGFLCYRHDHPDYQPI